MMVMYIFHTGCSSFLHHTTCASQAICKILKDARRHHLVINVLNEKFLDEK